MCQQQCSNETKGRWTAKLIDVVLPWISRKHGEVNFYLTHFFTGHGDFKVYLHRRDRKGKPYCDYCPLKEVVVDHIFFECDRCVSKRRGLETAFGGLGVMSSPESIIGCMLRSQFDLDAVRLFSSRESCGKRKTEELQRIGQCRIRIRRSMYTSIRLRRK